MHPCMMFPGRLLIGARLPGQRVRLPRHPTPVHDGLLVGFTHGLADVRLLVLQQLGAVEPRVDTERLQLVAWQPLPEK